MANRAVASKLKRPRSVTPVTLLEWLQLAVSAVYLSYHAVRAWLTVIVGRMLGKVNRQAALSSPSSACFNRVQTAALST
jgi:hypothetical protein